VGRSAAHTRAELWLVVKAGSLYESAEQRGFSRLVQHLAFDSTRHFDQHRLREALQHWGLPENADMNSFSGFDSTVYRLKVPVDASEPLSTALELLQDWASAIDFEPAQVAREQKALLEQRRASSDEQRLAEETLGTLLKGSTLDERLPFGEDANIERASAQRLARFYAESYRPERMALIAVGNFQAQQVTRAIRERFAVLSPRAAATANRVPIVALRAGASSAFATLPSSADESQADDEAESEPEDAPSEPGAVITVAFKRARTPVRTDSDLRRATVEEGYAALVRARLELMTQRAGSSFEKAGFFELQQLPVQVSSVRVAVAPERIEPALRDLLAELQRIELQGFAPEEVARALDSLKQRYAASVTDPRLREQAYFEGIMSHFMYGDALPAVEAKRALQGRMISEIGAAEINELSRSFAAHRQRTVLVSAPADHLPTPSRLEKIAASVEPPRPDGPR
jgi:zinc protease